MFASTNDYCIFCIVNAVLFSRAYTNITHQCLQWREQTDALLYWFTRGLVWAVQQTHSQCESKRHFCACQSRKQELNDIACNKMHEAVKRFVGLVSCVRVLKCPSRDRTLITQYRSTQSRIQFWPLLVYRILSCALYARLSFRQSSTRQRLLRVCDSEQSTTYTDGYHRSKRFCCTWAPWVTGLKSLQYSTKATSCKSKTPMALVYLWGIEKTKCACSYALPYLSDKTSSWAWRTQK